MEDYKKKYEDALERAKEELGSGCFNKGSIEYIFPELKESEDERIRKDIIFFLTRNTLLFGDDINKYKSWIAWLEKQGKPEDMGEVSDGYHTFNELYYYRMLYNAAFFNRLPKDWVHKSKRHHDGEECFGGGWFIVMANLPTGQISNHYELKDWDLFQIPEKDIADEWDGHTPQQAAERLHKYLLEKQGEQSITISVDKMVDEFENFKVISCGRIPSFMEIDAYRKGVNDALSKILIKEEKPITIGSKKAEGKLGEMIAASKEPAESGEDKELSHKEATKKSDKDGWSEEDENEVAILEAYITSGEWSEAHIDRALGIVEELVNKLKSTKDRAKSQPKWNEEDETYLKIAIRAASYHYGEDSNVVDWLKSIKERLQ